MKKWFKRDPLLHGLLLFLTIPAFILVLIVGFYIWAFATLSNPNYEEFGPKVELYKNQECAESSPTESTKPDCGRLTWGLDDMWKDNPQTLDKVVKATANQKKLITKNLF